MTTSTFDPYQNASLVEFDPHAEANIAEPVEKTFGESTKEERNKYLTPEQKNEYLKYYTGGGRNVLDTIRDVTRGGIMGLGKGGQYVNELMNDLVRLKYPEFKNPNKINFNEYTAPIGSPRRSVGGDVATGVGELTPYGIAGGPSGVGTMIGAGAGGYLTAEPEQENLFGLLPKGRLGSGIQNTLLAGLMNKIMSKLAPPHQAPPVTYAPKVEYPSTESEFTNIPNQGANFLLQEQPVMESENIAKGLNKDIIADHTPEQSGMKIAEDLNKKYLEINDYYDNRYNNLFDRDSGMEYVGVEEPIPVRNTRMNTTSFADSYGDYKFPDKNLQNLFDQYQKTRTIDQAHKLQSELGGEIGHMKSQNKKGMLDAEGKNRLHEYAKMRDMLNKDMHDSLERISKGLGDEYADIGQGWKQHVLPWHSNKKLKKIAQGELKNPKTSDIISIFKNPEEDMQYISSLLSQGTKDRLIHLAMGKSKFHLKPEEMIAGHNSIYNKGMSHYLDPSYEENFLNLRNTHEAERIAMEKFNQNKLVAENLHKMQAEHIAKSRAESNRSLENWKKAEEKSRQETSAKQKELSKTVESVNRLRDLASMGMGAAVSTLGAKVTGPLLGAYLGKKFGKAIGKKFKK